jgi:hypothetical protein
MSRNIIHGYTWRNISELIAVLEEIKRKYGDNVNIEKDEYPGSRRTVEICTIAIIQDEKYPDDEEQTYTIRF